MNRTADSKARLLHALIASDGNGFRRSARMLQSLWREQNGQPMGNHNGVPLGSRLPEQFAESTLANYLTSNIQSVVRKTLSDSSELQLFAKPRIYNDLLSSQPLCFNLFGELSLNYPLASELFRELIGDSVKNVTAVQFEYSPGRSSRRFSGDRSAFDLFVEYETQSGGLGFVGIEVKYHENLKEKAASHRDRYDEAAKMMNCFSPTSHQRLKEPPLQQFWRDHLLAGSMLADRELNYSEGKFAVLYPAGNTFCRSAVREYRSCLTDTAGFDSWTLEEMIAILELHSAEPWISLFKNRYLNFARLNEEI